MARLAMPPELAAQMQQQIAQANQVYSIAVNIYLQELKQPGDRSLAAIAEYAITCARAFTTAVHKDMEKFRGNKQDTR